MQVKILEPENFSRKAIDKLRCLGNVELSHDISVKQELADILFVRLGYQLDQNMLASFPALKYIVTPTTGEDHVDKTYLESRKIQLLSLKGETRFLETIPATAEFTWGLLLALTRNIPQAVVSVRQGEWDRDQHKGNDNFGKTISLVGFGRVAKIISRYAQAFGMKVKAYDPYVSEYPEYVEKCSSLQELVVGADILSIHASLTPETTNLVGADVLQLMAPQALVINTARGDIVDPEALLFALQQGIIAGAALDVLPGERCDAHQAKDQLLQYSYENNNLIITPHLAGATFQSMAMTEEFMVDKLFAHLEKGKG